MKIFYIFSIVLYLVINFVISQILETNTQSFGNCVTPDNINGQCIYLPSCASLYDLLLKTPLDKETEQLLTGSQCGYHNSTPLVCCPPVVPHEPVILQRSKLTNRNADSLAPENFGICMTPNRTEGNCIYLQSCNSLYSLILADTLEADDEIYITGSQCGYHNGQPLVCCPPPVITTQFSNELMPSTTECGIAPLIETRIMGGNSTFIDDFPWMALLEYTKPHNQKGFHCAGALITKRYVLTACHCVGAYIFPSNWQLTSVRLGEWDQNTDIDCEIYSNSEKYCAPPPLNILIEEIIKHEFYNHDRINKPNDIALLRLQRIVEFTDFVRPICLPSTESLKTRNLDGFTLHVAGWGRTENGSTSNVKLQARVPVINLNECNRIFSRFPATITPKQMCAGGLKNIDSCVGDSGGPIMVSTMNNSRPFWYVAGIVSFGSDPCGLEGVPGVYTKVSEYMDWIVSKIRI